MLLKTFSRVCKETGYKCSPAEATFWLLMQKSLIQSEEFTCRTNCMGLLTWRIRIYQVALLKQHGLCVTINPLLGLLDLCHSFWTIVMHFCLVWSNINVCGHRRQIQPHRSSASLKYFFCTSNWKMVLSQSVEALSLPPCFFRKASKPFSAGYFSLPINTTGHQRSNGKVKKEIRKRLIARKT